MGDDFKNRQCYEGSAPQATRIRIEDAIRNSLTGRGYSEVRSEDEATRSLVIGPADRWVFVGDSTGSTQDGDPDTEDGNTLAFTELSRAISQVVPVIDIMMGDSTALHMYLYRNGSLVDKFGNEASSCVKFASKEDAAEYQGHPEHWTQFLLPPHTESDLRKVWVQGWESDARSILSATAALFGWHPEFASVGYTLDEEGLGVKYDEYVSPESSRGCTELHFRKCGSSL
jgi:hypothetical protein